jgi:hypothetical protein
MFTELVQDTRAAVTLEFAPRLPPWSRLPNDHGAASRLRYAATRAGLLAGRSRAARIKLALLSVFWPAKATYDAVAAVVTYGSRVKAMSGIGRWRQWWGAMTLAHAWNFSPKTYYMYRLWDPAIRPSAPTFLQIHELLVLQMIVKGDMDTQVISSKATFAARCAAAGIPTPTVVATLARDAEEWTGERGALPRRDLFIKRVNGTQGIGGERWVHDPKTERWSRRDAALTESELLAHYRELARSHAILVQHCLANHPDLTPFSTGSLCTFRVMTYRDEDESPALLGLTLKMARGGSDVDNMHAGGIACPVDPSSGQVGPGIQGDPGEPVWYKHPDTHATIAGARLTTHRDVIDLALAAHRKLAVPWSVGWDVAATTDGPVLVEGNVLWGADVLHVPHRKGLDPAFAEALLRRVNEARR